MNKIMLDSGAYTLWKKGGKVNIDEYCDFIFKYKDKVESYVNLDVIPGKWSVKPTFQEIEEAARKSFENYTHMLKKGLNPIPVFHQGEDFKWLERYIDISCEYIGISPANDSFTPQKVKWLDHVFNRITDCNGYPIVKTHGFGITTPKILFKYPWYSVDSITWKISPSFGDMYFFKYDDIKGFNFKEFIIAYVSSTKDGSSSSNNNDQFKGMLKKYFDVLNIDMKGKDILNEISNSTDLRRLVATRFILKFLDENEFKFNKRKKRFFDVNINDSNLIMWKRPLYYFGVGSIRDYEFLVKSLGFGANCLASYLLFKNKNNLKLLEREVF